MILETAAEWTLGAAFATNVVMIAVNIRTAQRQRAARLQTAKLMLWLAEQHERLAVLDHVLMSLCCQACARDTGPVWQAWAQSMGRIRLEIQGTLRDRPWSAELFPWDETDAQESGQ